MYSVLICVKYSYVVRNLADYLSRNYTGSKKERSDICKRYKSLILHNAKDVPLPPPLEEPIPASGVVGSVLIGAVLVRLALTGAGSP